MFAHFINNIEFPSFSFRQRIFFSPSCPTGGDRRDQVGQNWWKIMAQCCRTGLWAEIKEMKKSSQSYSYSSPSPIIDHTPEGMAAPLSAPVSPQPRPLASIEEMKEVSIKTRKMGKRGENVAKGNKKVLTVMS